MAYYPDVTPGTPVSFSASRETAINRLLNRADSFKTGVIHAKSQNVVRVQVWNSTQTAFAAGQAVQIDVSGSLCGNAFSAVNFASVDAPFGVCANGIAPNAIGDLIFSGPSTVTISGTTGSYAKPVSGGTFERGNEGVKILNLSGGTNAVVMLGDYKHDSGGGGGGVIGFPNYLAPNIDAELDTQTWYEYNHDVWVIGNIGASPSGETNDYYRIELRFYDANVNSHFIVLYDTEISRDHPILSIESDFICVPIPKNQKFRFVSNSGINLSELRFYLKIYETL